MKVVLILQNVGVIMSAVLAGSLLFLFLVQGTNREKHPYLKLIILL